MVWRLTANNWYSIIINGKRHGFFHSTVEAPRGDPSPRPLFILGAEMTSLYSPRGGNILSNLLCIPWLLMRGYRPPLTKQKSFYASPNAFNHRCRGRKYTGFHHKEAPLTYLGCPLIVGRPRIIYFSELINKVVNRITGWQSKILSYGGKVTLIKHGWRNDKKKYHWSSWKNLSFPYDEGGIGVRLMSDVCRAFQFKQWWTFRSKQTLWGDFLRAKYCQRSNPISKKWDTGDSQSWRLMMKNKHIVESHIQWRIRNGSCSFWWDNWLGVGPLAQYTTVSKCVQQ
ncbi:hypothetical protein H5410_003241 [Solanum commersonii]|uniref:Uncharacterized protein n=1 Tax=Solanum commersonii TaxID=4109 RepID=A0A9J6B4H3_SOLCO|nr:hypothetical protein H5410_003241 [Solanum commersonii]